jgi:hypothetical protein
MMIISCGYPDLYYIEVHTIYSLHLPANTKVELSLFKPNYNNHGTNC